MTTVRMFNFAQLLTEQEISTALAIGDNPKALAAFFETKMAHIDKVLEQENDPKYLAYVFIAVVQRYRSGE